MFWSPAGFITTDGCIICACFLQIYFPITSVFKRVSNGSALAWRYSVSLIGQCELYHRLTDFEVRTVVGYIANPRFLAKRAIKMIRINCFKKVPFWHQLLKRRSRRKYKIKHVWQFFRKLPIGWETRPFQVHLLQTEYRLKDEMDAEARWVRKSPRRARHTSTGKVQIRGSRLLGH